MPTVKVTNTEPAGSLAKGLPADFDALVGRIRRRAYELFEQRGGEHGADRDDWLQAEAEITAEYKQERLTIDIPIEAQSKPVEIQTPEAKSTESWASAASVA